ncbi:MAG: hypothetical protein ACK5HR_06330 [Mycoplasmatales bacterium]
MTIKQFKKFIKNLDNKDGIWASEWKENKKSITFVFGDYISNEYINIKYDNIINENNYYDVIMEIMEK